MPSPQKIVSTHRFQSVNTDIARELLGATEATFMLNCVTLSTAQGDVGIVTNLKGNTLISIALHEGRNRTIGWAVDEEVNKFYYFVWNENGYHTVYRYDGLLNKIDIVFQSITDTGGVDILRWKEEDLITMADVVRNTQLYWVKRGNDAAKINIEKAMDKSDNGYGFISEDYINAYKLAPAVAPINSYASDTSIDINNFYGTLIRTVARFRYDDGEESNYSDYSNVATPAFEAFTGVNFIPTENNRIDIKVPTGSGIVTDIEIAMQYTIDGGLSPFVQIVRLNKKKLGIGDNSEYTYAFYNENRGRYPVVDQEKVIRPYSYLPDFPLVQAFTENTMIYGNFKEGFPVVDLDISVSSVDYTPLFLDEAEEPVLNDANILVESLDEDYIKSTQKVTYLDGTFDYAPYTIRANKFKMTIGSDVKEGNTFSVRFYNGYDDYNFSYAAKITDTASSVANKFKQLLIGTGKLLRSSPEMSAVDIYATDTSGGNASFEFILYTSKNKSYYNTTFNVNDVNTITLKDTGQSVGNAKLGASRKYGIVYEDFKGKRSLAYTDTQWIVPTDTQNDLDGIKKVSVILNINHKPPVWAKTYQIVRTAVNTEFIQMLIQKVIEVQSTLGDTGEYLDLLVGSLYTYQQIHPNTTLKYQFKKGDRLRLLTKEDGEEYYDFFETEILEYNDVVNTDIKESITIDGTDKVLVVDAIDDNIGKFIIVDGVEREILGVDDATHYLVNSPIGDVSADATFFTYTLVDRRGSIRIRKPSDEVVPGGIEDGSMVEIFSPDVVQQEGEPFYHFNKKFNIIDAGTDTRQHFGDIQSQTDAQPAKVSITEAEIYVRQREMPITNTKPAQVVIRPVEDPAYSDYYYSIINDNGKTNAEDTGIGVVDFGDRLRASNNYVEDTKINGLNDFDNLDRRDYNDKYGAFKRLVYTEGQLLAFKELKVGIIPIYQKIIEDNAGLEVLGTSNDLLNPIRYYSHAGGINNNPEAYARNESWHYYADVNKGQIIRLAGDGATPVSEIYNLDSYVREVLSQAYRNGGQVFLEWDVDHSMLIVSVTDYNNFSFNSTFSEANWKVLNDEPPEDTPVELLDAPDHATATLDGTTLTINIDDYVGTDSMSYRAFIDGQWVTKNICLDVKQLSNRQTAWRARTSDAVCETEGGEETGTQIFITLEQYWTDTGELTGETKPNTVGQPDYVAPIQNLDACPFSGTVYYSVEKSGTATRNNCPSGQTGSLETYTVVAGAYTSIIDQATADGKAQNDVDLNKQAYANSEGTCTSSASFGNDARTQNYTKNNCGGGLYGSSVPITVAANTYYASTKAAANVLRDNYISANGQSNANTLGTCSAGGTFTFEAVIYPGYKGGVFLNTDSRGISFEFFDVALSHTFYQFLVSSSVLKDSVVHTYSIPISGSSIYVTNVRYYQQFNATSVGGGATDRSYVNGVLLSTNVNSVTGGQASGTQYNNYISVQNLVFVGDTLRLTFGDSPTTTYYSAAADFPATKNNCPAGAVGSTETLSLPYGLYNSTISQMDADAQATTYGNANKQSYANTNGSCAYGNDLRSGVFTTSNCPEGFTGGDVTYTVPANTYFAPTKAEANADAEDDVADNGQDYANDPDNQNCTEIDYPDFTFLEPWGFTDQGALNSNTIRTYDENTMPTAALWTVRDLGYGLRIAWENSANCPGGTNDKTQSGTASVDINVTTAQNINIIWSGVAEKQATTFDTMELRIDGVLIGKATSPGGGLGCLTGDVVSTLYYPSGYPLTVGVHTVTITATTGDPLYHVGCYYDFVFTVV